MAGRTPRGARPFRQPEPAGPGPRHALLPLAIGAWAVLALVAVLLIHIVARMLP